LLLGTGLLLKGVIFLSNSPSNNDFRYLRNLGNLETAKTVPKLFHLNERTFKKGKRFAQLLDVTHSQLIDRAIEEYIAKHQSEVPVAFTFNSTIQISPEIVAAIQIQASTQKLLLKQQIDGLKTALQRQARSDHLIKLCDKLNKQTSRTYRFLKSAKGYHDEELLSLLTEASLVLETMHTKNSGERKL
jgi:predicted component of type VI protein secretion system